jgi:hypothetical protein
MTERPSAIETAREILAEVGRGGPKVVMFTRGLALGALVGAAIAGMAVLDRRARSGRRTEPNHGEATGARPRD